MTSTGLGPHTARETLLLDRFIDSISNNCLISYQRRSLVVRRALVSIH